MRIFLTLSLFFSLLNAKDYFDKLVKDVYISEDMNSYKKIITEVYENKKIDKFSIKLLINKDNIKDKVYYMSVISDIDSLIYTNAKFVRQQHILVVKLDKDVEEELIFNYRYETAKRGEFRINIINEFEHDYMLHYEGILYGIAYGIIFCAFLYYLIIFISTKKLCFLYYSIMQFFVLLSLIGFVYFSFKSFPTQDFFLAQAIVDIFETLGFLFILLFAREILQSKKVMPNIDILLNFFIFLNILDLVLICIYKYSILYIYLPFSIGFLIPTFAGSIAVIKGVKYAKIYSFGWFLMSVLILLIEERYSPISGIYSIHIIAPLESLIFSFALGIMLRELVNEQNEKEKFLIHKSKLASMGEMINNIAHQWRQPLTHLSFINMNLQLSCEDEHLDKKLLVSKLEESNEQIDFMSNTIDSFRDFYKPTKEKELFWISEAVKKSIDIMLPLLEIYSIKLNFKTIKDKQIRAYENEYCQVILNLVTNAKDELIQRKIKDAFINIEVNAQRNKSIVKVCDNAGGIEQKNINKIYEPYFSTKENGSGIGLYMSKTIINSHFRGDLKVKNIKNGVCFSIEV